MTKHPDIIEEVSETQTVDSPSVPTAFTEPEVVEEVVEKKTRKKKSTECEACDGKGRITDPQRDWISPSCEKCQGTGVKK